MVALVASTALVAFASLMCIAKVPFAPDPIVTLAPVSDNRRRVTMAPPGPELLALAVVALAVVASAVVALTAVAFVSTAGKHHDGGGGAKGGSEGGGASGGGDKRIATKRANPSSVKRTAPVV